MPPNRISILVALEGSDEGLKRALRSAERSLGELSVSAKTAGEKATAGVAEVKAGMAAFGDQVNRAKGQLLAFLTISWAAGKVQEIVQVADAWNQMAARLKLATAGQREFSIAQRELFAIAQRIGVPLQETATLYGKLQKAVRGLGLEQQDALALTESISQALRISGASTAEAQAALLQFGQALAAGVLRGEEFNSVVENSPRLAQALADGLNVPIGRLRKLAEEGRLTADVVVRALMSQKDILAAEYAQLPQTVSQAFQRLSNAFGQWLNQVDTATGFTRSLAAALTSLSEHLDTVMAWLKRLAEVGLAVLIYRLLPALITAWETVGVAAVTAAHASAAAWLTVNQSLSAAVASLGVLRTAFATLGAFAVGWEIGTWLSEQFVVARRAGIAMVELLLKGFEQLQYRWEVFAALFTADRISEATRRHQVRLAEMNRIFAEMIADATKGTAAAQTAMTTAAATAEEITQRLAAVRQGTQESVGRGAEAVHAALDKLKTRLTTVEQTATQASQTANDATAKMAEGYRSLTSVVESTLQQQVAAVQARYAQEQAALETTRQSEAIKLTRSTQLLTDALAEQTRLRQQATADTLVLLEQESLARLEAARRHGVAEAEREANVQRVENEILATRRQTLLVAVAEYRQHIDALNAEANRHLSEIQRIEEQKRLLSLSTEERIREILRQGMSEAQALEDRKRQIAEYQAAARAQLAAGEFEQSRQFAQKALDLAAQVASSQASDARRSTEARRQSEQAATQAIALEAQSRDAYRRKEYATAVQLHRQAEALRTESAQKEREADQTAVVGKQQVNQAIGQIRTSEDLLRQALEGEARAHQTAAQTAVSARESIRQTLTATAAEIEQVTTRLRQGVTVTIDADTARFDQAIFALDRTLSEKGYLLAIQADLTQAERQLQDYAARLKAGETLPVDADVTKAQAALVRLKTYAEEHAEFELSVVTAKAETALSNVARQIQALSQLETESRHLVSTNVAAARAEIQSLNGANTASTHTIYVRRVEANAAGGVVGWSAQRYARGGPVAPGFPRMRGGSVPGSGNQDTVPRTLDAGSFVLRRAAVRRYGSPTLSRLANGVARFAAGGTVNAKLPKDSDSPARSSLPKQNREAAEALQMIELGLKGIEGFTGRFQWAYGPSAGLNFRVDTLANYNRQAQQDRELIAGFIHRPQLTSYEQETLERIKETWRLAMRAALNWGDDLERGVIDYLDEHQAEFYARGGIAGSDTVPALLTPGEFVVNKSAVSRLGVGFLEALNNLSLPARALATNVQGFADGGWVQPAVSPSSLSRSALSDLPAATPARTIRVELAAGNRTVTATVDARDEARLLDLLKAAQSRTT
ncbi:phage tail tape measure protein [Methylolobus aquaticus]|nr:phage tail tape measure protein [Methylolobus aquaticus]